MKNLGWILLAFILGILCSGCAKDRLTIVVRSVQSDVEFEAQYELDTFPNKDCK